MVLRSLDKGTLAELKVRTALAESGRRTLTPDQVLEYDLVFEENEKFYRVQVKKGKWKNGAICIDIRRSGPTRPVELYFEVDYFGVWCDTNDKCYLIPAGFLSGAYINIRVEATKNGQRSGINWAKAFEIAPVAQRTEQRFPTPKVEGSIPSGSANTS